MGFSSLFVRVEPDHGIFFPGHLVTGNVHASVDSETKCRDVKITCKGKAKVHWTSGVNEEDKKQYDSSEEYFKMSLNLWNGSYDKIDAGEYVWPFQFLLPHNIPSSFEGEHGWVRYSIKTKADIPSGIDKSSKMYFCVNDTEDLNINENAMKPMCIQKSDTTCFWCCAKGPVQLNFNCPRSGAVVGEGFKIRGEISNEGAKPVESTIITLTQDVKFYAKGCTENSSREVAKIEKGSIQPGESEFYDDVPLYINSVIPNLTKCHIIDLEYKISFSASFGTCASVSDSATLYIGTVPFLPEGMGSPLPVNSSSEPPPYSPHDPTNAPEPLKSEQPGFIAPQQTAFNVNPHGLKGAPSIEQCFFCVKERSRLDKKSPPPKYLSYANVLNDAP